MQRKSFEECKSLFLQARHSNNWNDVANWSTELLKHDRNQPWAWANRGVAYTKLGFPLDAILNFEKALAFDQEPVERAILYSNIGAAHWDLGETEPALRALDKAIALEPLAETYLTLGNVYKFNGDTVKALQAYQSAIAINPDYVDGHLVYGMTLLSVGKLAEGWKEYEWRWKSPQLPFRKMKAPQWAGEDLTDKSILVYGEQGLGDIIQFGRYARIIASRFPRAKVIVEGRQQVKRLFDSIPEIYAVMNVGDKVPPTDYVVPMVTLAGLMTPHMCDIPPASKEYSIDWYDVDRWKDKFKELPKGLRIGVCWSGMARTDIPEASAVDAIRSTELNTFAPLAKIPGIVWVSLQKGPPASQVRQPPAGMTIADYTEEMYDFYETCAAMLNCDLVITVDTAVAHAAASVGVPTWVLSRWDGCWRWFGKREDSPWYPSVRQFVQPAPHDWNGMVAKVATELTSFVEGKKHT